MTLTFPPNNLQLSSKNWGRALENRLVAIESNFKSAEINNLARDSRSLSNFARLDVAVTRITNVLTAVDLLTSTTATLDELLDDLGVDLSGVTSNIYFPGTTQLNGARLRVGTVVADTVAAGFVYAGSIVGGQITGGTITGTTIQTAGPSRIILNNSARSLQFTDGNDSVVANVFSAESGFYLSSSSVPDTAAQNFLKLNDQGFVLRAGVGGIISGFGSSLEFSGSNGITFNNNVTMSGSLSVSSFNPSSISTSSISTPSLNISTLNLSQDQVSGRLAANTGILCQGALGVTGTMTYIAAQGTGTAFPLYWNSTSNVVYRLQSSERYKTDIKNAEIDYEKLIQVQPRTFKNKKDVEDFGIENAELTYGYIAEEMHDLGLTDFVVYEDDENGNSRPESVNYMSMAIATHALIKHQDTLIKSLEARLTALETQ